MPPFAGVPPGAGMPFNPAAMQPFAFGPGGGGHGLSGGAGGAPGFVVRVCVQTALCAAALIICESDLLVAFVL